MGTPGAKRSGAKRRKEQKNRFDAKRQGARRSQGLPHRSRAKKMLRFDSKSALNSGGKNEALRVRNWKKIRILAFLELTSISGFH